MNKDNLFDEQKIFLIYLMGLIPDYQGWALQVDYKKRIKAVDDLSIKDIELSQADIDLANMHNKNIEDFKKDRLKTEKGKRISEINKEFGIQEKPEIPENPIASIEYKDKEKDENEQQKQLWDVLQGKGIIKKGE